MSEENQAASSGDERTEFKIGYRGISEFESGEGGAGELNLYGNIHGASRPSLEARVKEPLLFREALFALYGVVKSDQRYVPKDRTAYLAYQNLKKQNADKQAWEARQAYFEWLERNDPDAWMILDPIMSVYPDRVLMEVFSKDEGVYAALSFDHSMFENKGEPGYGTTNIDFSEQLFDGIRRMRGYRETLLGIRTDEVEVDTRDESGESKPVIEKKISVPASWLRGFLQIQSAAMLPMDTCKIAPMDLYNVLRHLRLNADKKGKRRAVRIELVPGEHPRLVLEPWETLITTGADIYRGTKPRVVRLWGRRRLALLGPLLSRATEVDVHILGSGLPSFFVLKAGPVSLTLALSGFSSGDWGRTAAFDLLFEPDTGLEPDDERVLTTLSDKKSANLEELTQATGLNPDRVIRALQAGCRRGLVMYDLEKFRARPLTGRPLDVEKLRYRNRRERLADDLLARPGAVVLEVENRIFGTGTELKGLVKVENEGREYSPSLLIGEEGRVSRAKCTCSFYRKHGLTQGPCEHLIALRVLRARKERDEPEDPAQLTVETRTFTRRLPLGEKTFRLSLERRRLRRSWSNGGAEPRKQTIVFNSEDDARAAYFQEVEQLRGRGFLDTTR